MVKSRGTTYQLDKQNVNTSRKREAIAEIEHFKSKISSKENAKFFVERSLDIVTKDQQQHFRQLSSKPDNGRIKIFEPQNKTSIGGQKRGRTPTCRIKYFPMMGQDERLRSYEKRGKTLTCRIKYWKNIPENESDAMPNNEKKKYFEADLRFKNFSGDKGPKIKSYAMSVLKKTQAKEAELSFEHFF